MVGTSPRKQKSKLQSLRGKSGHSSRTATSRSSHQFPLAGRSFFLDLKNHNVTKKLQTTLESLGAKVEDFLVEDVNYVVTHRQEYVTRANASYPSPLTQPSPASSVNSPAAAAAAELAKRGKTRAECMLEKARCQPQQSTYDPLDNAIKWGINIYAYENIAASVERLLQRRSLHSIPQRTNLVAPYIKFESVNRNSQPVYGELSQWPCVNLKGPPAACPFHVTKPRTGSKQPRPARRPDKPPSSLGSTNQGASKQPASTNDTLPANHAVPRMTRKVGQAGTCDLCNEHYGSLPAHLTSDAHRRAVACSDNFAGLDALIAHGPSMSAFLSKHVANSRRSQRQAEALSQQPPMTPNLLNGSAAGAGTRKRLKAAGARTRSMSGGQLYLPSGLLGTTAEDGGNPLRIVHSSSSGGVKRASADPCRPADPRPTHEMNGGKRRRPPRLMPRRSQLALLSDEAQNFMFRETPASTNHSSSSEGEGEDCGADPDGCHAATDDEDVKPCERVTVKVEPDCLDTSGERRRKRRSQAEAFITDNRDYYKFETPGSRLRFHDDKDVDAKPVHVTVDGGGGGEVAANGDYPPVNGLVRSCLRPAGDHDLTFMFQTIPQSEPWYETFRRQDRGEEYYYSMPSTEPPFLLPYQLPAPPRLPYAPLYRAGRGGRGRGRRRRGHLDRKPRKSPRCHASTLAILSGFIQRRKRDPNKVKEAVAMKEEPPPPPVINPPIRCESDADVQKLADSLDQVLDISGDELEAWGEPCPPASPPASPLDSSCEGIPVCDLLRSECCGCVSKPPPGGGGEADPPPRHHNHADNWRTRKKKKRKNLTGWPNAKRAKLGVRGGRGGTDDTASCGTSEGRSETEGVRTLRSAGVRRRASPRRGRN